VRRIVIAIGTTLSGLVLLFSWPTSLNKTVGASAVGSGTSAADDATAGVDDATTGAASGTGSGSASADDSASGSGSAGGTSGTYTGAAVSTRWGPVQVEVTVADGVITGATAVEYPTGNHRDQEINAYAIPVLEAETVDVQSATLDMVSGATVTSQGYVRSLQDALDQAGL
jgi:uncharacterized protein with FMN-binding domain